MGCVALRVSWGAKSQRDGRLTENCARIHPMFGYPMSPAMPGCLWVVDHWWYSALCTLHVSVSNALAVALCVGLSELLEGKTPVRCITEESKYQLNEFRVVLCVLPCACFGFLRIVRGTKQAPKREKTPVRRMCCLPVGGATQVVGAHRHTGTQAG